jgi:hypothetical protein
VKAVETKAGSGPVLEVRDLSICFGADGQYLHAVNRVSLQVGRDAEDGERGHGGADAELAHPAEGRAARQHLLHDVRGDAIEGGIHG